MTPTHLKNLKKNGLIWMFQWKPSKDTVRYHVKKGPKATIYRWRMLKSDLKFVGFIRVGGSGPWMCDFKNGEWKPLSKEDIL